MSSSPRARHYLMCPPQHFDVVYAINPWMDVAAPVDRDLALAQWWTLVGTYRDLGHRVDILDADPALPDMVFAANGATVVDGRVLVARFATPQRAPEAAHHLRWHSRHAGELGWRQVAPATAVNEAEGDFVVLDDVVLAGHGFRTDVRAHAELAATVRRPVVGLRLVDPRFYHLDTALAVLDDASGQGQVVWYPPAFDTESQQVVQRMFPEALVADETDALVFGLNLVSDGTSVVVPVQAEKLTAQLAERGWVPVPVDLSELRKGGGGPKCCTQELRPPR